MNAIFDVAVVGLGAMGSAAAFHLAQRGQRVLGLDRFTPPHSFGSSHGQSRIIREAYYEDARYVPLVQRAYQLWNELEQLAGCRLFRQTGGLAIGRPDGELVSGVRHSAGVHGLAHEVLTAGQVRDRFPAFQAADPFVGVWEARASILFPEACIQAHLDLARRAAVTLRFDEPVAGWEMDGELVRLVSSQGEYRARQLVISSGAWTRQLLPGFDPPLTVERQVLYWFDPAGNARHFQPDRCPIMLWEYQPDRIFYSFPDLGEGVKVARHHQGEMTDADHIERTVKDQEIDAMRALLQQHMPDTNSRLRNCAVCMYTDTPDLHFLLDFLPGHPQVLIASPCSGHGFKFSSVLGEIMADLLTNGRAAFDLSLFSFRDRR